MDTDGYPTDTDMYTIPIVFPIGIYTGISTGVHRNTDGNL